MDVGTKGKVKAKSATKSNGVILGMMVMFPFYRLGNWESWIQSTHAKVIIWKVTESIWALPKSGSMLCLQEVYVFLAFDINLIFMGTWIYTHTHTHTEIIEVQMLTLEETIFLMQVPWESKLKALSLCCPSTYKPHVSTLNKIKFNKFRYSVPQCIHRTFPLLQNPPGHCFAKACTAYHE